ncbi:MAG: type IV toxin-antitoxin system AbiEi family antitoxin [Candidatus Thorarchaeota archaeon]
MHSLVSAFAETARNIEPPLTYVSLYYTISANVETLYYCETEMNGKDLENTFRDIIYQLFNEVGVVEAVQIEPSIGDQKQCQPDMLISVKTGKRDYGIAVEIKSIGQPRFIRMAAQQLKEYLEADKDIKYGIMAAPYISEEGRQLCRNYGIGCIDLAGNAWLAFNNLYINVQGKENPYPTTRGIKSLFTRKSTRAIRVLLTEPKRLWFVQDLAREADLSLGQTSNIKRLLIDEDLLLEEGKSFRLVDPQRLLDAWTENYSFKDNESLDFYAIEGTQIERKLSSFCKEAGIEYGLALFSGANLVAPSVRYNRSFIYVEDKIRDIARQVGLKEVTSGPNVTLLKPYDKGVFYGVREVNGLSIVSDVQLYLDLKNYQGRGEEAARYILEDRIKPSWQ